MDKLGVGVIGVGTFGELHARLYKEHRLTNLLAVADINEEKAKKIAEKYGAKAYSRYEDLLKDPEIKAVSIVIPDPFHKGPCVSASEAGKHILVEKPLATTVEDAKVIIETSEKYKVKLMVDFMNRWNPPFSMAKESIESGEIGELLYINMRLNDSIFVPTEMLSWADKSSVLWFLGSHAIDLLLWLVNNEINQVSCISRSEVLKNRGINTPDFYHSVLEFENGVVANLENSWILPNSGPTLFEFTAEIVGTKGKIDIDTAHNGCIIKANQEKYYYPEVLCTPEVAGRMSGFAYTAINHFIECVLDDKEPSITKETGLNVTKVITKLQEAEEKHQFIHI